MKLLLDEHFSEAIAEILRRDGHDVDAAVSRLEIRGRPDLEAFAIASDEGRVLVTENVRDFAPIAMDALARGVEHAGLILVSAGRFNRRRDRSGQLGRALRDVLSSNPTDRSLAGRVTWLDDAG